MTGISSVGTKLNTCLKKAESKANTTIPPSIKRNLSSKEAELLNKFPPDIILQILRQTPQAVKDFVKLISMHSQTL